MSAGVQPQSHSISRLFVYGTLQSHCGHPMSRWLAAHARIVSEASCAGRLYDLGQYPGWVAAENPRDRVWGELWELPADAAELWDHLDAYEGCDDAGASDAEFALQSLFRRQVIPVRRSDGGEEPAWIYAYGRSLEGRPWLRGGRWPVRA